MQRALLVLLLVMILAGCAAEPAYTPDMATLAQREAAEYEIRIERSAWMWRIFVVFVIVGLTLLSFLLFALAGMRYRTAAAEARRKLGEARRAELVGMGDGYVLDLSDNTIYSRYANPGQPDILPTINSPERAAPAPDNQLYKFVLDAISIAGVESDTIPRYDRWADRGLPMDAEKWVRYTNDLAGLGLISKSQGTRTHIIGGNLAHLLQSLPHPDGES